MLVYKDQGSNQCKCFNIAFWCLLAIWIFYGLIALAFLIRKINSKYFKKPIKSEKNSQMRIFESNQNVVKF